MDWNVQTDLHPSLCPTLELVIHAVGVWKLWTSPQSFVRPWKMLYEALQSSSSPVDADKWHSEHGTVNGWPVKSTTQRILRFRHLSHARTLCER